MRNHVAGAALAAGLLLSSSSAVLAADPGATVYDWNGFYAGGHVGFGWGDSDITVRTNKHDLKDLFDGAEVYEIEDEYAYPDGDWGKYLVGKVLNKLDYYELIDKYDFGFTDTADIDGFLGGIQVGYNIQNGNIVFGIEGDASFTDLSGSSIVAIATSEYFPDVHNGAGLGAEFETSIDWIATLRGRIGYAFDNVLVYATGGLAAGDVNLDGVVVAALVDCGELEATIASISDSDVRLGYVVGAGAEIGISENASIKGEYQFIDLGDETFTFGESSTIETDVTVHVVKVGFNYRFPIN